MGGVYRGSKWWWDFFKDLFFNVNTTVKGSITLGYGMHSLNIPIEYKIKSQDIYLNCQDNSVPVCVGMVSMASATLNKKNNTFTLIANVQSNSCTIKWLIEYEPVIE